MLLSLPGSLKTAKQINSQMLIMQKDDTHLML